MLSAFTSSVRLYHCGVLQREKQWAREWSRLGLALALLIARANGSRTSANVRRTTIFFH